MVEKRFILASPHLDSGLCNRLKCIISLMRLREKTGETLLVHWPISFTCGTKFSELFENKLNLISDSELSRIKEEGDFFECNSYEDLANNKKNYSIFNSWRFILIPGEIPDNFAKVFPEVNGKQIDLEYERTPQSLRNEFLKYFSLLKPIKYVQDEVRRYTEKYNFKKMVGVHVRRTEFLLNADGRGKVSSDELFFKRMHELLLENPETKFFLATDSKDTEHNFIREFGNKIVLFSDKNWDKSTKESTQHALIDILLLSKTSRILGTYLSTFTEVAWWLGDCKPKVEIMGNPQEMKKVLERYGKITKHSRVYTFLRSTLKEIRRKSAFFRRVIDLTISLKNKYHN